MIKTNLKYTSNIEMGDFAIVHHGSLIVYGVKSSYDKHTGRNFDYPTSSRIPGYTGRLGRIKDATKEERISGLDKLIDVHLILRKEKNKGDVHIIKFEPYKLVLVEDEQDIRNYFAQNKEHIESEYSGGTIPGLLAKWKSLERKSSEEIMKIALEDYKLLKKIDITKEIEYLESFRIDSYELAKRIAELNNEESEMLQLGKPFKIPSYVRYA